SAPPGRLGNPGIGRRLLHPPANANPPRAAGAAAPAPANPPQAAADKLVMPSTLSRSSASRRTGQRDWGSLTEPGLTRAAEGGGTTGPMSPSGASSRSTITGA